MNNELKINKKLIVINIVIIIIALAYLFVSRIYFKSEIVETGAYEVSQEQSLIEFKSRQEQGYTVLIDEVEYTTVSNINKVINNYRITVDNDNKHIIMTKKPDSELDNQIVPVVIPIQY